MKEALVKASPDAPAPPLHRTCVAACLWPPGHDDDDDDARDADGPCWRPLAPGVWQRRHGVLWCGAMGAGFVAAVAVTVPPPVPLDALARLLLRVLPADRPPTLSPPTAS